MSFLLGAYKTKVRETAALGIGQRSRSVSVLSPRAESLVEFHYALSKGVHDGLGSIVEV